MTVAPMLGDWEIPRISLMRTQERRKACTEAASEAGRGGPCPGAGPAGRSLALAGTPADALAQTPEELSRRQRYAGRRDYIALQEFSFSGPCRDNPSSFLYGSASGPRIRRRE